MTLSKCRPQATISSGSLAARSAMARSATSAGEPGRSAVARAMTAQKSSVLMARILPVGYDKIAARQDGRMRPISLPDVPYGATAVRPMWPDLPESLREAISSRLGGPVAAAQSAGGGFTRAFAAVLTTSAGARAFVKAAPLEDPTSRWYAREASITSSLPPIVAAARPRWTLVDSGYFVLCLEAVDGHVPALPWSPPELDAALAAWTTAAEALAHPSAELLAADLPSLPDILRGEMSW